MAAPFAPAGGGGRPDVLRGLSLKQKPLFPCATHFLKAIFPHNATRIGGNGNLNFHLLMACRTVGSGSHHSGTLPPSRQQHPLFFQSAVIFGNRIFKEVIKIKWGHTGSPQTSTSLYEGEGDWVTVVLGRHRAKMPSQVKDRGLWRHQSGGTVNLSLLASGIMRKESSIAPRLRYFFIAAIARWRHGGREQGGCSHCI